MDLWRYYSQQFKVSVFVVYNEQKLLQAWRPLSICQLQQELEKDHVLLKPRTNCTFGSSLSGENYLLGAFGWDHTVSFRYLNLVGWDAIGLN